MSVYTSDIKKGSVSEACRVLWQKEVVLGGLLKIGLVGSITEYTTGSRKWGATVTSEVVDVHGSTNGILVWTGSFETKEEAQMAVLLLKSAKLVEVPS